MKYIISLGFLASILTVPGILSTNTDVLSVTIKKKWLKTVDQCFGEVPEYTLESYITYHHTTVTKAAKCLTACILFELGKFIGNEFNPDTLEKQLRKYVGFVPFLNEFVKLTAHTKELKKGDKCDEDYQIFSKIGINDECMYSFVKLFCCGGKEIFELRSKLLEGIQDYPLPND